MKSRVFFKSFVLSSVFSASLSYSALTVSQEDFITIGLQSEFNQLSPSVQAKLKSDDLGRGLAAAISIDKLTDDKKYTTSKDYLNRVLKVLSAYESGDAKTQDDEAFRGFEYQIGWIMGLWENASIRYRILNDSQKKLKASDSEQLQSDLKFAVDNEEFVVAKCKEMARVFWVRRVGHNPNHNDAFESFWTSLFRYKRINLIVKTLEDMSKNPQIRNMLGITEATQYRDIELSKSLLQKILPPYLLMELVEFTDDVFSAEDIKDIKEEYPELKNIPHFQNEGKSFTIQQIELLKITYPKLKEISDFEERKLTFEQLLDLREKYIVPYQAYWAGDNEGYSLSETKVRRGAAKALDGLGLRLSADYIRFEKISSSLKELFKYEIQRRGQENPKEGLEQKENLLLQRAKQLWIQHHLGKKALSEAEPFPEEEKFQAFFQALQTQAHIRYVLSPNTPDKFESLFDPHIATYELALNGDESSLATLRDWKTLIDDQDSLFKTGDKEFYENCNITTATEEDQERFAQILKSIWTKLVRKELEDAGLNKDAVQVYQRLLQAGLSERDPQEEKKSHPKQWIGEIIQKPTGEAIQKLLKTNTDQVTLSERLWFETQGQHISNTGAEVKAPGIEEYDAALEALQNKDTLTIDQRQKLLQSVADANLLENALKAAQQHATVFKLHSFMKEISNITDFIKEKAKQTGADPVKTFIAEIASNHGDLLDKLSFMVKARKELTQMLGESFPQLVTQLERLDKISNKLNNLNSSPAIEPLHHIEIFNEFEKLSSFAQKRDFRKSAVFVRQWLDRKPLKAEGYDHVLMARQFISVAQDDNIEPLLQIDLLKKIWGSNTYHPNLEDYMK